MAVSFSVKHLTVKESDDCPTPLDVTNLDESRQKLLSFMKRPIEKVPFFKAFKKQIVLRFMLYLSENLLFKEDSHWQS